MISASFYLGKIWYIKLMSKLNLYQSQFLRIPNSSTTMNTIILFSLILIGFASAGHHAAGHDNAHYQFAYGVHDPHTHDHKSQHEHRHGPHVTGGYTLEEADGTHRIVKYKSGPHSGFEAVVERVGHAQHPAHYGHGHGGHGHGGHGGVGGTSYVGVTHWSNQGNDGHGYGH